MPVRLGATGIFFVATPLCRRVRSTPRQSEAATAVEAVAAATAENSTADFTDSEFRGAQAASLLVSAARRNRSLNQENRTGCRGGLSSAAEDLTADNADFTDWVARPSRAWCSASRGAHLNRAGRDFRHGARDTRPTPDCIPHSAF
jgi:hypothetical protein